MDPFLRYKKIIISVKNPELYVKSKTWEGPAISMFQMAATTKRGIEMKGIA